MARLVEEHGAVVAARPEARAPRRRLRRAAALDRRAAALDEGGARPSTAGCWSCSAATRRRPKQLLAADPDEIRAAGPVARQDHLPARPRRARRGAASSSSSACDDLPDEEVIEQLTAVKGIGEWTRRHVPDVPPRPPRRAARRRPGHPPRGPGRSTGCARSPTPSALEKIAKPWRPYRTLACLYLWSSLDNKPGDVAPAGPGPRLAASSDDQLARGGAALGEELRRASGRACALARRLARSRRRSPLATTPRGRQHRDGDHAGSVAAAHAVEEHAAGGRLLDRVEHLARSAPGSAPRTGR